MVAIGLASRECANREGKSTAWFPGDSEGSMGWFGDGQAGCNGTKNLNYGPQWGEGDTVGIAVHRLSSLTFLTLNGRLVPNPQKSGE